MEPAEQARSLIIRVIFWIGPSVLVYWITDYVLAITTSDDDDLRMRVCATCASLVFLVPILMTVYGMLRMESDAEDPAGDRTESSVRPSKTIDNFRPSSRQGPNAAWRAELNIPILTEHLVIAPNRLNPFREARHVAAEDISQEVEADHEPEVDLSPENSQTSEIRSTAEVALALAPEVHPSPQVNIAPEVEAAPEFRSIVNAIPDDLDDAAAFQRLMNNILFALDTEREMNTALQRRAANGDPEAIRHVESSLDRTQRLLENMLGELRASERGFGALNLPVDEYVPAAEADPNTEMIPGAAMRAEPHIDLTPPPAVVGSAPEITTTDANCVVCNDVKDQSEFVQAPCEHTFCRVCFRNYIQAATWDESLYPPTCCNQELPLSIGLQFLELGVVEQYRKNAEEFSTSDRTYCNQSTCSAFIPLQHIQLGVATCPECRSDTCSICKGRPHGDSQCPENLEDGEMKALLEKENWVRCPNCKRIIELEAGCNHVT